MTSEDLLFEKLKRPSIQQMAELVRQKFGNAAFLTDEMGAFLRKHHWFLDDYMRELTRIL